MISELQYRMMIMVMKNTNDINLTARALAVHRNTVSKYINSGQTPQEQVSTRSSQITKEVIKLEHWEEIKEKLEKSPELEATAAMEYLLDKYPKEYTGKETRSLQRKFKQWKAEEGDDKEVMFSQIYRPGERSQSDFVHMNYLKITIAGEVYNHILYHFMLPYSGWEDITICEEGESFENLCKGYEKALWRLMGVTKQHRTDNLTAAVTTTKDGKYFTENWQSLNQHYGIEATTNNAGKSNENGKVERSNGLFKRSLENHLSLRGSKEFKNTEEYRKFIDSILIKRNKRRAIEIEEEKKMLGKLPEAKWYVAAKIPVKVYLDSTIRIDGATYSVPSRTIGSTLFAYIYPDKIELRYSKKIIETMPRCKKGEVMINYLHVVDSLRRKPGAFADYKYKDSMYPTTIFRQSYDMLIKHCTEKEANKNYVEILYLAKIYTVFEVADALKLLAHQGVVPLLHAINKLLTNKILLPDIDVIEPILSEYDAIERMN
jgi:hypothetical protein